VVGDFTGTGIDGIAGVASDGSVWYTTDMATWTNIPGLVDKLVVKDLNGDGVDDLVARASDGSIWYHDRLVHVDKRAGQARSDKVAHGER